MSSVLLIVTGASRGLGKAIATSVAQNGDGSISKLRAVLVSRSSCRETQDAMAEAAKRGAVELDVFRYTMDLSDLESLDDNIGILERNIHSASYGRAIFVNNAGSLGHLGPTLSMVNSLQDFRKYLDFNVTSSLFICVRLLQCFAASPSNDATLAMVNISSLCAVQPVANMASYCAGKAARDMFHMVVATELETMRSPINAKTLNYAPGALDTAMTTDLRSTPGFEQGVTGDLIAPVDTARRLVNLVLKNKFKSGAHIDYWDLNDQGDLEQK